MMGFVSFNEEVEQYLCAAVLCPDGDSHRMTLKIVGIGVDRADVILIVIALVGAHILVVSSLFTRVLGLIAPLGNWAQMPVK
jgi:hypothetical protein